MRPVRAILLALVLWLLAAPAPAEPVRLRILHVNDFHGFAEPHRPRGSETPVGGVAHLAAQVRVLRQDGPCVLLAAGDMIQGNPWANLSQGASAIEVMNAMGFDAMAPGNHEFDFGQEVLTRRIGEATFPLLAANVDGFPAVRPWVILERGGLRVAVIGAVTADSPAATHPRNVAGLRFRPPEDAILRALDELRGKADVVVALTHLGHGAERALAEKVQGLDAVVGGHSHTRVVSPAIVGTTAVVQAWEHGKALGVLDFTVDGGKVVKAEGRLVDIVPKPGSEDPGIQKIVETYAAQVEAVLGEPVGVAAVLLDGERVRQSETNLGNLVADAVRAAAGAETAILNGGGIRTSIRQGEIRLRDVYAALPFDNYAVAVRLNGRQIVEALEHGVSGVERGEGRFPQVSGLTFAYAPSAPAGGRVKKVWVGTAPLDLDRAYTVATNDFLAAGGDGYQVFGDAVGAVSAGGMTVGPAVAYADASRQIRDLLIAVIREQGNVTAAVEGRIREVDQ